MELNNNNNNFDDWEQINIAYQDVKNDLDKSKESLTSIGQIGPDTKVYFDSNLEMFYPSAGAVKMVADVLSSWSPFGGSFFSGAAKLASSAARTYYNEDWKGTKEGLENVEQWLISRLYTAETHLNEFSTDEKTKLFTELQDLAERVNGASLGLSNLKKTYDGHANAQDIQATISGFVAYLLPKINHTMELVNAKLNPEAINIGANHLNAAQQATVDEAVNILAQLPKDESKAIELLLANSVVKENMAQEILLPSAGEFQSHKLCQAETKWLKTFQVNGESLQAILDKLTDQGAYSMTRFVTAFVSEASGKGPSLRNIDPSYIRLQPIRIGGLALAEALQTVDKRKLDTLRRLVEGYWTDRAA